MNAQHRFTVVDLEDGGEHEVVFRRADTNVTMTCSCRQARHGQFCHHRLGLLSGDDELLLVLEGDPDLADKGLICLCKGTDVEHAVLRTLSALNTAGVDSAEYTAAARYLVEKMDD